MSELIQRAKLAARDNFNDLERPEQDIMPVLLTSGKRGIGVAAIEMPDDDAKDEAAQIMTAVIALSEADECAFVCTAWMAPHSGGEVQKPSLNPERQEKVVIMHWHPQGSNMHAARVIRHDNRPPDLGAWDEMGGAMGGRFGEAVELGLKLAATVHEIPGLAEVIDEGWATGDPSHMLETFLKVMERNQL